MPRSNLPRSSAVRLPSDLVLTARTLAGVAARFTMVTFDRLRKHQVLNLEAQYRRSAAPG